MYEQGSFEPVARVVQLSEILEKQRIDNAVTHVWQYVPSGIVTQDVLDNVEKAKQPLVKIYHYHCNHLGTPQELTNQDGDVIWLSYDRAWGGSFETIYKPQFIDNYALQESELQPIKFQGQSLDVETGLHYNRFRYYDSDVGMFISRDPIGLLGGNNVFQYAPNPIGWIDPWGLNPCNDAKGNTNNSRRSAFQKAKKDANVPKSQQPDKIFDDKNNRRQQYRYVKMTDKNGKSILDKNGNTIWTREYQFTTKDNSKVIIQDHSAGHKFPDGKNEEGSHFNVRPIHDTRNGKVSGTKAHYEFN